MHPKSAIIKKNPPVEELNWAFLFIIILSLLPPSQKESSIRYEVRMDFALHDPGGQ